MITDVLIHSPFPLQDGQGNSVTADRLEKILIESGVSVEVEAEWYSGCEARCFIALNARRSAGAVGEFRDACPDAKVVIVLTGTDINHPEVEDETSGTYQTMAGADALVVLHEGSLAAVPESLRGKCDVIYPSVALPAGIAFHEGGNEEFEVIMAGNVRVEKNLPVVLEACDLMSKRGDSNLLVRVYGDAEGDLANALLAATAGPLPFQWKRKTDHENLIKVMAGSSLLLNSSTQEGGANAVCEAMTLGLPVVASDIPGNVGMLGGDYMGYFPSGDAQALADLMRHCSMDQKFYTKLIGQVVERAPLFTFAEESRRWLLLLRRLSG